MEDDIAKKVAARFEELPEAVQTAIRSADFDAKMQAIVQKHKLHIDQAGALGDETLLVMMGFAEPAEFAENLAKQLSLGKEASEALAKDVSDSLFVPIREAMQEFVENRALLETLKESAPAAVKAPSVAPAPTPLPAQNAPEIAPPPAPPKPIDVVAETMLSEPTSSTAPEKPITKVDPYREPVE